MLIINSAVSGQLCLNEHKEREYLNMPYYIYTDFLYTVTVCAFVFYEGDNLGFFVFFK